MEEVCPYFLSPPFFSKSGTVTAKKAGTAKIKVTVKAGMREIGEDIADRIVCSTVQESGSALLPLEGQVSLICHYLKEHPIEADILLRHFTADDTVIRDILLKRFLTGQIKYSASTERYDENTKRLLFHFLIHGMYNLIRCWILEEIDKTPEDIGVLAADIALHGWLRIGQETSNPFES